MTTINLAVPLPGYGGFPISALRLHRCVHHDGGVELWLDSGRFISAPDPEWEPGEGETEADRPDIPTWEPQPKVAQPTVERIEGTEFLRFLAWRTANGAASMDSYGVRFDRVDAMRWLGWREYHRVFGADPSWPQMRAGLEQFLVTTPPEGM